jgi:D-alanyl-D-alanine carboxypeptidase
MLPSGNDAALTLAENFGVYFYFQSKEFLLKYGNNDTISNVKITNPAGYFVKEMNETTSKLGLTNTFYSNPHGSIVLPTKLY